MLPQGSPNLQLRTTTDWILKIFICQCFWSLCLECDIQEHIDTNNYPNIFVSTNLHEQISKNIHRNFLHERMSESVFVLKIVQTRQQ